MYQRTDVEDHYVTPERHWHFARANLLRIYDVLSMTSTWFIAVFAFSLAPSRAEVYSGTEKCTWTTPKYLHSPTTGHAHEMMMQREWSQIITQNVCLNMMDNRDTIPQKNVINHINLLVYITQANVLWQVLHSTLCEQHILSICSLLKFK